MVIGALRILSVLCCFTATRAGVIGALGILSVLCCFTATRAGSWDSYIGNLIAQSKGASGEAHIDKGVIIGLDGGAPWTTSGHPNAFMISSTEGEKIARCFKSKDFTDFMSNGVTTEGVKYQFLRVEDDKIVCAKMKGQGSVTLQSSKTAIVIAHCPEGSQQGNANKAVGVIAEYLEGLGL